MVGEGNVWLLYGVHVDGVNGLLDYFCLCIMRSERHYGERWREISVLTLRGTFRGCAQRHCCYRPDNPRMRIESLS